MFLLIKNVLSPAELEQVRQFARGVRFIDGRTSNPHNIAKNNLQADMTGPDAQRASQIANAALARNEELRNFAFPKRIATPVLSRYEPGMTYGIHSDAPFLPVPPSPLRSDISATLFVGDPSAYDGGELRIHLGTQSVTIKGNPGEMIVYPSNTLHEVVPVTRGERLAFFTFMESMIPDHVERDLLYTLNEVYALEGLKMTWDNRTRLQYVINNLTKTWSR